MARRPRPAPTSLRATWRAAVGMLLLCAGAPAASAEVLQTDERTLDFGVSLGVGYLATEVSPDGTADLLTTQVGVRSILYSHWEADLDLRIDFDPAASDPAESVHSYTALLWIIAELDFLPLTPFLGAGGGVVLDGADPSLLYGTVGGCVGLALWFEGRWRVTLRGAQRWVFDEVSAMPLEVLAAGEYFF